jgi:hypothetical protein
MKDTQGQYRGRRQRNCAYLGVSMAQTSRFFEVK